MYFKTFFPRADQKFATLKERAGHYGLLWRSESSQLKNGSFKKYDIYPEGGSVATWGSGAFVKINLLHVLVTTFANVFILPHTHGEELDQTQNNKGSTQQ